MFILIVFVVVSCAGPNKVGWTKPDFRQDEFEKDREECLQAVKNDPQTSLTLEECLAKKGYESEPQPPSDIEKVAETAINVGKFLLAAIVVLAVAWVLGVSQNPSALQRH